MYVKDAFAPLIATPYFDGSNGGQLSISLNADYSLHRGTIPKFGLSASNSALSDIPVSIVTIPSNNGSSSLGGVLTGINNTLPSLPVSLFSVSDLVSYLSGGGTSCGFTSDALSGIHSHLSGVDNEIGALSSSVSSSFSSLSSSLNSLSGSVNSLDSQVPDDLAAKITDLNTAVSSIDLSHVSGVSGLTPIDITNLNGSFCKFVAGDSVFFR